MFSQFKNETLCDTGEHFIVFFNIKSKLYLSETCPYIRAHIRGMNVFFGFSSATRPSLFL